ncbi:MAG TPA: PAS domain-containing protein, partial [Acidimicrobiia bacterium]
MTDGGFPPVPAVPWDGLGSGCSLLFDANPLAMWVHHSDSLRLLEVNEAAVRQYGWSRRELLSMTVLDLFPPEDRPAFLQAL